MTWLLDILMGMLGIATWQKKGRHTYPRMRDRRRQQQISQATAGLKKAISKPPVSRSARTRNASQQMIAQRRLA